MLVTYCGDHPVAVCPTCGDAVPVKRIGADLIPSRRDLCPGCGDDLTAALRQHLADCTWISVQAREVRERSQELRQEAQETVKQSEQACHRADVLVRQAEEATEKSRRVKRGEPPA